jgi:hypothetical protein
MIRVAGFFAEAFHKRSKFASTKKIALAFGRANDHRARRGLAVS